MSRRLRKRHLYSKRYLRSSQITDCCFVAFRRKSPWSRGPRGRCATHHNGNHHPIPAAAARGARERERPTTRLHQKSGRSHNRSEGVPWTQNAPALAPSRAGDDGVFMSGRRVPLASRLHPFVSERTSQNRGLYLHRAPLKALR